MIASKLIVSNLSRTPTLPLVGVLKTKVALRIRLTPMTVTNKDVGGRDIVGQ